MAAHFADKVNTLVKSLTFDERRYLKALAMGETVRGKVPPLLAMRGLVHEEDVEQMLTHLGCEVELRFRPQDDDCACGRTC